MSLYPIETKDPEMEKINNKITFPDGTPFYLDIKNGEMGYNTEEERGADTFHPFRGGSGFDGYGSDTVNQSSGRILNLRSTGNGGSYTFLPIKGMKRISFTIQPSTYSKAEIRLQKLDRSMEVLWSGGGQTPVNITKDLDGEYEWIQFVLNISNQEANMSIINFIVE